ncbi:hypothetical protein ElyMa_004156400 [Elysia marginata]|uniref:Uncharacterized protein n=1 Tax=Elysia marginata TaxID=1093978 RepID=A0AAV4GGZ8_9GAST|nr:hypothetical protein ElyMa_004156400 [Elysia marginata]
MEGNFLQFPKAIALFPRPPDTPSRQDQGQTSHVMWDSITPSHNETNDLARSISVPHGDSSHRSQNAKLRVESRCIDFSYTSLNSRK